MYILNRIYVKRFLKKSGISLIEAMIGMIIFCLIFVFIFRSFAPTATASQSLLRGTTIAMNAGNWYLNDLERAIQSEGALSESDLGKKDVTYLFGEEEFSDIKLLKSLKVTSEITLKDNLYSARIIFTWGNTSKDDEKDKTHKFEMSRLIVQPSFN